MSYSKEKYLSKIQQYKSYYQKNRSKIIQRSIERWIKNRDQINQKRREKYAKLKGLGLLPPRQYLPTFKGIFLKEEVIKHYGGICACCRENNLAFLTIDHIYKNGKDHKGTGKNRYKGNMLYRFLKSKNYPEGIQILCFNCNIGQQNNKNVCPHKS